MAKHRKLIEDEDAAVKRLQAEAARLRKQRLQLQEEVVEHTAGKLVRIKNHLPFVVTEKDVDEYGDLESACGWNRKRCVSNPTRLHQIHVCV